MGRLARTLGELVPMTLTEYLDGMRAAATAADLEKAIRAPHEHRFTGRTWERICTVRIESGRRICDAHQHGRFVPRFGGRRLLTVCGETYRVARGYNSAGVRYAWHYATEWATGVFAANGLNKRAASLILDTALNYPHRALGVVGDALAGKLPMPRFDRLIYEGHCATGTPVQVDRKHESRHRAHRPCRCGGLLWDWGCGWNGWAEFISWRCDRCPRVYTEYVTGKRLREIRERPSRLARAESGSVRP